MSKLHELADFIEAHKGQKRFTQKELMHLWGLVCSLFVDQDFNTFVRNAKSSLTKLAKETPAIIDGELNVDALTMYMFGYKSRKYVDGLQEKFRSPLDIIRNAVGEAVQNSAEIPNGFVVDYREEEIPEHTRSAHIRRTLTIDFD